MQARTYKPLARPLFIYTKVASFTRPEVQGFVKYMIDNEVAIAKKAGFISLTKVQRRKSRYQYSSGVAYAKKSS